MVEVISKAASLTIIAYFVTLILSRLLGRKLISQMTFFDFVVGVILGSAAVNASTVQQNSSLSGFIILIVITLLTLLIDFTHIKSILLRKTIESEPVTVIENGKIVDGNMKKIRLTTEELMMLLREKNTFNIADVEFAVMEIDGKLSVQPKSQKQPLTPSDLNIPTPYKGLTRDLIIDGKILQNNLNYIDLNEQWLMEQIKGYGIQDVKDVFYAGLDTSGNLYVSKKQEAEERPGKYGIE
jgi:uncharacterized membrane protein YcaP (DUF421 family)